MGQPVEDRTRKGSIFDHYSTGIKIATDYKTEVSRFLNKTNHAAYAG
jgi:hypothetical protein